MLGWICLWMVLIIWLTLNPDFLPGMFSSLVKLRLLVGFSPFVMMGATLALYMLEEGRVLV
ncbi:hypothetical protein [Escherichia coli]|uniref:hypothetical protein n=1 Tax=Escherichia coli TaxID=562 RepID=UPI001CDAACD8|nr:hypothetical protein [Escherichia coli]